MANDDDAAVVFGGEAAQEPADLSSVSGVEVGGGFVGEQDGRVVGEGAGDGDALLFPARELVGSEPESVAEPDAAEKVGGSVAGGAADGAGEVAGELDVLAGAERREEVEVLEDEPEVAWPAAGEPGSGAVVRSTLSMTIEPLVGRSMAPSIRSKVVLPLPEGPMPRTTSPAAMSRSTPSMAWTAMSPAPKVLVRCGRPGGRGCRHKPVRDCAPHTLRDLRPLPAAGHAEFGSEPTRSGEGQAPIRRASPRVGVAAVGARLFAGSHAPHERQPDGLAAPVGVRVAVDVLVTVAGTFAVDHRTAAGTGARAQPGLVPPVLYQQAPGSVTGDADR